VTYSVLFVCTELLPPGGYPIAVKYIISYYLCPDNLPYCDVPKKQPNYSY